MDAMKRFFKKFDSIMKDDFPKAIDESMKEMDRGMYTLQTKSHKIEVFSKNGHISIKIDGVVKSLRINGKEAKVEKMKENK